MNPTVQVLMSTFNGERYLAEQIDSIINQEGVSVRLRVRDDGSTDGTHAILDDYMQRGLLEWTKGENIGWAESFMQLIYHAPEADFYALSDQDDIWLSDKLKAATSQLSTLGNGCLLYGSNLFRFENGQPQQPVYQGNRNVDLCRGLLKCFTAGCTMVFNRQMQAMLSRRRPEFLFAHDFWIYVVALSIGHVVYDEQPHILYRQHENNQIGDKRTKSEIWKRRIKQMKSNRYPHPRERMAAELLRLYGADMTPENRDIVNTIAQYRQHLRLKAKLLTDSRFTMGARSNNCWLRLRILLNRL